MDIFSRAAQFRRGFPATALRAAPNARVRQDQAPGKSYLHNISSLAHHSSISHACTG
jgi:hypothetical protein